MLFVLSAVLPSRAGVWRPSLSPKKPGLPCVFRLKYCVLVAAHRALKGIHGGYSCTLDEISLGDVIGIVEGNMVLSRCLNEDYPCNCDKATCHFHAIYDEISQMVQQRLNEVKFSDLYGDLQTE